MKLSDLELSQAINHKIEELKQIEGKDKFIESGISALEIGRSFLIILDNLNKLEIMKQEYNEALAVAKNLLKE